MIIIMIILLYSFFFGDGVAGAKVGGFVAVQTWRNRSNSHRCLSCDGGLELGVNNEPEDEGVVGVLFENDTCGISFARVAFPPAKITNRFHYNQLDHLSPPFSGELGGCDTTEAAFITPACDTSLDGPLVHRERPSQAGNSSGASGSWSWRMAPVVSNVPS